MTLGNLLKQRRELIGLTLRQVEESLLGVSNSYLSQLENDKIKKPSMNVLYKLSRFYGIEIDELLYASGIISDKSSMLKISNKQINGIDISEEEERELIKYLKFLRFEK